MTQTAATEGPSAQPHPPEDDIWRQLMHRWFVEYNPLYLLSAALVLGGIWLLSREAANGAATFGHLSIEALAEVYACTLIAGAALLWRLELKRPAVMLGLLAALYQGDLTLHVETSAYLGVPGYVGSVAWVALFVLKLRALAWALRLKLSRSAFWLPSVAAAGFALLPQLFRELGPDARSALLGLFVFGVGAAAAWTSRKVEAETDFDVRGRRAVTGTWLMWAALGIAHMLYWASERELHLAILMPVAALLATRALKREYEVWMACLAVLLGTAALMPLALSSVALMVGVVLVLHAQRRVVRHVVEEPLVSPYREVAPQSVEPTFVLRFEKAPTKVRERLLLGALVSFYVAAWTPGWSGGPWPQHVLPLDAVLVVGLAIAFHRARHWIRLVPVAAALGHLAIEFGWVSAPEGAGQWGLTSVGLGFSFLLGSLAVSYRLEHKRAARVEDAGSGDFQAAGTPR